MAPWSWPHGKAFFCIFLCHTRWITHVTCQLPTTAELLDSGVYVFQVAVARGDVADSSGKHKFSMAIDSGTEKKEVATLYVRSM